MGFLDDLEDLAEHTVVCTPGSVDSTGTWTAGTPFNLTKCYITGETHIVRDFRGAEVVSTYQIISLEVRSLDPQVHRFTLPNSFPGDITLLRPHAITLESDEDGPLYEEIYLP